jgi:hypothetical protein
MRDKEVTKNDYYFNSISGSNYFLRNNRTLLDAAATAAKVAPCTY